jgi:hypothetical protein
LESQLFIYFITLALSPQNVRWVNRVRHSFRQPGRVDTEEDLKPSIPTRPPSPRQAFRALKAHPALSVVVGPQQVIPVEWLS